MNSKIIAYDANGTPLTADDVAQDRQSEHYRELCRAHIKDPPREPGESRRGSPQGEGDDWCPYAEVERILAKGRKCGADTTEPVAIKVAELTAEKIKELVRLKDLALRNTPATETGADHDIWE